ncbi:MAG: hypothetical protein M3N08_09445 [Pseudomonadota bacterium]|nr:hypothetical protein [Pseudomonadota bacterium]
MPKWGIVFFVLGLTSALLGFGWPTTSWAPIAQYTGITCAVLFIGYMIYKAIDSHRPPPPPRL